MNRFASLEIQESSAALERDLASCLRISEFVFSEPSLNEFLRHVLGEAMTRIGAERGSVFLLDRQRQQLVGFAMVGIETPQNVSFPVTQGIVGHVVATGEMLNVENAYDDPRFFDGIDKQTGYRTEAVLCCPIIPSGGTVRDIFGALELLNPASRGKFSREHEQAIRRILEFASVRLREYSLIESLLTSHQRLENEVALIRGYNEESTALRDFVGVSPCIEKLKRLIWTVAPYDASVLVCGESGTGKELVARALHSLSARKRYPFVALNCAAVPETLLEAELFGIESGVATGVNKRTGRIEQANGGTLFLDEIGEMPLIMQAKLLRVIQEREVLRVGGKLPISVDVRIVAATHRELDKLIVNGQFREDLFYRLKVVQIDTPPLRERKEDIPFLARHFLDFLNEKYHVHPPRTLSQGAVASLQLQDWPGNIRQLQNEVERMFILTSGGDGVIEAVPHPVRSEGIRGDFSGSSNCTGEGFDPAQNLLALSVEFGRDRLADVLARAERILVEVTMSKHKGNRTRVAEELGISREGLRKMLHRWESDAIS